MKTPDYVIFASAGNDSIALTQWAHEEGLQNVVVAYSNTGWAASWWPLRVAKFAEWVKSLGFDFAEIPSEGMEALITRKKGWPANKPKFCTFELKILPAQQWLEVVDPYKQAVCMIGIRREESKERRNWPLIVERSESHGGRELYSPLVEYDEPDRDELVIRAGWAVLPHRSKECSPCVNLNRDDGRRLAEEDIEKVERNEERIGRTMFRPKRFMGARGIRQVIAWARSERGKYEPPSEGGCDSGMCGG